MDALYFLLPIALALSALGLSCFLWSMGSGQYDDLEGPRWRILYDDEAKRP